MAHFLMTVGETADFLKCDEKTVYRNKEKIPGYVKIAGRIYFNRQTLEKWTVGHQPAESRAVDISRKMDKTNPHGL